MNNFELPTKHHRPLKRAWRYNGPDDGDYEYDLVNTRSQQEVEEGESDMLEMMRGMDNPIF